MDLWNVAPIVCGIDIGYAQFAYCFARRVEDTIRVDRWDSTRVAYQDDKMMDKIHSIIDFVDSLPEARHYAVENQFPMANKDMIAIQYALVGHLEHKFGRDRVHVLHPATVKGAYNLCRGNWSDNKKAVVEFVQKCGFPALRNHNMADAYLLAKFFLEKR